MKHSILGLISVCSLILGFAAAPVSAAASGTGYLEAVESAPVPVQGQQYHLRHCIMYEKGTHIATNYWRGALVPINTKVTLVSMGDKEMTLRLERGDLVRVENVPNFTRVDMAGLAKRMLSATPVSLDGMDESMARSIKNGAMRAGMTKEQVVMARGYPPGHQTSSLELDSWKYWSSRFVVHTVVFQDGVLAAGRGIN